MCFFCPKSSDKAEDIINHEAMGHCTNDSSITIRVKRLGNDGRMCYISQHFGMKMEIVRAKIWFNTLENRQNGIKTGVSRFNLGSIPFEDIVGKVSVHRINIWQQTST